MTSGAAVEAAFTAGYESACEHGDDPLACAWCRLTGAEVEALALLHRPHLAAAHAA